MRQELTSLDLTALVRELQILEGARIDKIYQRGRELSIHVYKPGDKKYRLFLGPGKIFLTSYKRENPEKPPNFCMNLRKNLSGARIERIEQHGFDRILNIHTDEKLFVAEIFGKGNYILVEKGPGTIISALDPQEWSDRAIYRGETYKPPSPGINPEELDFNGFKDLLGTKQIVKILASDIGLGGMYAEEILHRADVDKAKRSDTLDLAEVKTVFKTMQSFLQLISTGDLSPRIYYQDNDPINAVPIAMATFKELEHRPFDTFSTALDTYFTQKEKAEYRRRKMKAYREKKAELERRKEQQEQMLEGVADSIEEHIRTGDLIYENYGTIEQLIETLKSARKQYSADEIEERLTSEKAQGVREAQIIEQLDLGNGRVVVDLGETNATIDIDESVEMNAERYYKKSKEAKRKVEGARKALENTKKELEQLEENKKDIDVSQAFTDKDARKEKKRWYENFRWFFSSDDFLVVGGRDATSNEVLVKKHMQKHDVYVHPDFEGAPSVVVKNPDGRDIPEQTLIEAAQLGITYSKAWKINVAADDAYWVHPDQVTKEPEPGEYLSKGAFVIRGDRNYLRNVSVSASVGAYERGGQYIAMGGPLSAIQKHCSHYVGLRNGRNKKSDVAKKIQHHLHTSTGEDFDLDRIIRAMPPGKAEIAEKK